LNLSGWEYLAVAGAGVAAGAVNALAGGGTLISFPVLVGVGVPPVRANVTNTVSLVPGYLSGSWAQRDDLKPELAGARVLAVVAAAGGLAGSVLLLAIPPRWFRTAVPFLIVASCVLLLFQDRLRDFLAARGAVTGPRTAEKGVAGDESSGGAPAGADPAGADPGDAAPGGADPAGAGGEAPDPDVPDPDPTPPASGTFGMRPSPALSAAIFGAAVYGGFFGAGLSIMVLAILGVFSYRPLTELNALKQALSFVINLVAAVFFAFSGKVVWSLAAVIAVASLAGGFMGGRVVTWIDPGALRNLVVAIGFVVAIVFWVA
jgi:uncharacterized membrane protein YfcA